MLSNHLLVRVRGLSLRLPCVKLRVLVVRRQSSVRVTLVKVGHVVELLRAPHFLRDLELTLVTIHQTSNVLVGKIYDLPRLLHPHHRVVSRGYVLGVLLQSLLHGNHTLNFLVMNRIAFLSVKICSLSQEVLLLQNFLIIFHIF